MFGPNSALAIAVIMLVFLSFAGLVWFFLSQIRKLKDELTEDGGKGEILLEWLREEKASADRRNEALQKQFGDLRGTLDNQIKGQSDVLHEQLKAQREESFKQTKLVVERLEGAQKVIAQVQNQLGGITEFGKDMKDLSNVLKSPKLRGGLGEQFLYELLADSLPKDLYKTQYAFKTGAICDAVIFTDNGIIPIDSKFSMENFKLFVTAENEDMRARAKKAFIGDVKKRIDEIADKYILPQEGTTEQAVMYVPSENIFYELIVNSPQVEDYAKEKSVVLASPNTLNYFLKIILVAYGQHQLERHAGEILKALSGIKRDTEKFGEEMGILEKHISNSYRSVGGLRGSYQKILDQLGSVQMIGGKDKKLEVEGPETETDSTLTI